MKRTMLAVLCLPLLLGACATIESTSALDGAQQYLDQGAYDHAYNALAPMAMKGDPLVDEKIGNMYLIGEYMSSDFGKAYYWLSLAASKGDLDAMNRIWIMCASSSLGCGGKPHNQQAAEYWLGQAAKGGNIDAEVGLAAIYAKGDGAMPRNLGQSRAWALQALDDSEGDLRTLDHPAPMMQAAMHLRPRRFSEDGANGIRRDIAAATCLLVDQYAHGDGAARNVAVASAIAHKYAYEVTNFGTNPHATAGANARGTDAPALEFMPDCEKVMASLSQAYSELSGDQRVDMQPLVRLMDEFTVSGELKEHGQHWPKPAVPNVPTPAAPSQPLAQALRALQADLTSPSRTLPAQ